MDAERMNKQEQLHIKDNETLQVEKSDNGKLCKVDSLPDISSKSAENIINEVVSTSMQTSTDSYDNEVSCQSEKQFSQRLHKPMTIDIDSKAADAAEVKSQSVLELSDDYLTQMMKNVNDREIALYGGAFLISDETECSQVCLDHDKKQNLLPVQEALVTDVSNQADNSVALDEIEIEVDNNENIDKSDTSKQDLLPSTELLIVDESNSSNDTKETEKEFTLDKIEIVVEKRNDTMENLDLKEKSTSIDNALVEEVDHAKKQNLPPVQEALVIHESNKADDSVALYEIEMVGQNNDDSTRNVDVKEKLMTIHNAYAEEVDNNGSIDKSDTSKQDLLPGTELFIVDESNSSNDTKETEKELTLDKIEIVVEKRNDTMENLNLKEKSTSIDNALVEEVDKKKCIDKSITNKQDFLSSGEHFMVDKSNSSNDINKSENKFYSENIDKLESAAVDVNENQSGDGKMPVVMLEYTDVKKGFSRNELKEVNSTAESNVIINSMQRMNWLKHLGGDMEGNRRKLSRKPSIETEDCQEDVKNVKEEPIEDAKLSSKSARRRSSQSKNRKAKAIDSSKQDTAEDRNKKSSSDVRLANTSKNETSKLTNVRAVEKSKDTKSSPQILGLQRSSIGRGRNDRRKVSLGNPQTKAQSDISDQWNKTPTVRLETPAMGETSYNKAQSDISDQWNKTPTVRLEIPAMEEKSYNKDEAHSIAGGSSVEVEVEVEKVEDLTENVVATDSSKSKKPEVCETEIKSRLPDQPDNSVFLHNQLSVRNNDNEPSIQKNEEKIDMKKEHLPLVKNDEDSQNKSGKNLSSRPIYGRSTDESKKVSLSVRGFGQNMHDFNKQENCATKNTGFYSTSHDAPRWNHNNYSERQNMNNFDFTSQKGFTSNRHRNITEDENKQNEESFGKNQVSTDKYQGSKGYSDTCYDSRTSGGRYNERNQDNRHFNYQYSDKNQDHRNYREWNSTKNQDGRSYSDIVSDKNQNSRGDRHFLNQNHRGFGEGYSERFQDRTYGERYSDKVRDSKNTTDRYADRNQQSKTSCEISSDRGHDGNQMAIKKQEPMNRNSVGFDKNSDSNQAKDQELPNRNRVNSDKYQDIRNPSNKNNVLHMCERQKKEQEMVDTFRNQFLKTPEPEDGDKVKQNKSDVKSQKHYDNTQQAKVQKGLRELQQSFSVPTVAHQPEHSSSVDQNVKLHEKVADLTNTQPIQGGDWTSYKNTSKQDAVQSADIRCASPYSKINVTVNPTVTNEYNSQYNETLLNSSNQFNSVSNAASSEQKPNVVMNFDGNENVQRALGMDPSHFNQSQSSQANTDDLFRSNTNSPTPQQACTSANVAQYYHSITSSLMNPPTTSAYSHSTMNVNAPPFEVKSGQKSNDQQMYAVQYAISNSQDRLVTIDNDYILESAIMNEMSNNAEEYLKLNQEISELGKKLSIKQSELVNLQMKSICAAKAATKTKLNQAINSSIQHISHSQLVQQQNQPLPSNYVQVKHPNFPPGFGDVSLNVQSTQMNVYEMSTNVANAQNYPVEKLSSNSISEPKINAQPVYLAQSSMYQQQAANYQIYTDKTANSAAHNISQIPEQRQIRGSGIQFSKQ